MNCAKKYVIKILTWFALSLSTGFLCGLCGALFSKTLSFVTALRLENNWLLFLLPIGGLITVTVYKLCGVQNVGISNVFEGVKSERQVPFYLSVAVFIGTAISHLFGASAGREGAALQIGGSAASLFAKMLRLDNNGRRILIMCGMSALFSALFGTPLAAAVFVIEIIFTKLSLFAFIPVFISSVTAFVTSSFLGVIAEKFHFSPVSFSLDIVWKTALITLLCVGVGFLFCYTLNLSKRFFKHIFNNPYIRILVGGIAVLILSLALGTRDYNGGGTDIIERIFNEGVVKNEAFVLKIIFTVISVGAGYKGGEIIPTLFIGATSGAVFAILLNIPLAFGAAIGMAVLLCAATKCPVATIILCAEMFSGTGILYIVVAVMITFILARYDGLYGKYRGLKIRKA